MKRGEASTKPKKRTPKAPAKPSKASKKVKPVAKPKVEKPKATKTTVEKKAKTKEPSKTKAAKPEKKIEEKAKVATPTTVAGIKPLLKLREEIRKGRPKFLRQESWRYVRVGDAWRRPKGTDSRMRLAKKGWPSLVNIGYRGPVKARGLHPSGFRDVLVNTVSDLEKLNPETDAVRFASSLGARKRREILNRAEELGLKVLNPRGLRVIRSKE
jgi:large subunit ribosomal protein L32e